MNVIITGASRGIGYEITKSFSRVPDIKIGVIARNKKKLDHLVQETISQNVEIIPYNYDLSQLPDQPEYLSNQIRKDFEKLDIVVNNAGLLINKPFSDLQTADYLQSLLVNFLAPALFIRELVPLFETSHIRHIVNIGSMGGYQGSEKFPGLTAYSTSKAALANLTESLAVELKDKKIRVNCLALGAVQTEMLSEAFPGYRTPVNAEDMGAFIFRFATTAGKVMNGKIIPVSLSAP